MSALGIPALLWSGRDGAAMRESSRELLHTTLSPVGLILAEELSEKLEHPVTLDFYRLAATDVASRARALGSLVKAGVSLDDAKAAAGLDGTP